MTFLRARASWAPSNFGTPTRLGAACALAVRSTPNSSARQPIETRGIVVVTRPECSIRKRSFTRTQKRCPTGASTVMTIAVAAIERGGDPRALLRYHPGGDGG